MNLAGKQVVEEGAGGILESKTPKMIAPARLKGRGGVASSPLLACEFIEVWAV